MKPVLPTNGFTTKKDGLMLKSVVPSGLALTTERFCKVFVGNPSGILTLPHFTNSSPSALRISARVASTVRRGFIVKVGDCLGI